MVRQTAISLPSVRNHVQALLNLRLIKHDNRGLYRGYKSSLTANYKLLKKNDLLLRLEESAFINDLEELCTPNCIILYGSGAEGLDDERGDVDLFIESKEQNINISKYEKLLKRKISLSFARDITNVDNDFINTLANGIVLRGFFKVK